MEIDSSSSQTTNKKTGIKELTDSPVTWKRYVQKREDEEYSMISDTRGKAIIFNHLKYDDPHLQISERDGTDADKDRIKNVLDDLGFETKPYDDRTFSEIQTILEEVSKEDHTNYDCLVVVVMSHGEMLEIKQDEKKVGKLTQIWAKDKLYNEEELWKPFSEGKCDESLLGKPKLFFIQACRIVKGKNKNKGLWVPSKSHKEEWCQPTDSEEKLDIYSIPNAADLLIARCTFEECYAYRDEDGTWFIQNLCEELELDIERENQDKYDLLRLLTNVNRNVALNYPEYTTDENSAKKIRTAHDKQMPNFYSTLTRLLYFRKKCTA